MLWRLPLVGKISRIAIDPPAPRPGRTEVAIAAILRDEAAHVGEWAAFHYRAGVRRFVIYDNGSRDGTRDVLARTLPPEALTVVAWDQVFRDARFGTEIHNQVLAYAHAARNYGGGTRWMAFIDVDEFLIPKAAHDIPGALAHLDACACLSLPWHMFGRSGHATAPWGGVLASYTRRARDPMSRRRGVRAFKCIVDPCRLTAVGVHDMQTEGDGASCNDRGARAAPREREAPGFYSAAHLQLNHYYTRSEAELAAKIGRGPNLRGKAGDYARKVRRTVANIEADEVEDDAAPAYMARIGWAWRPGEGGMRTELIVATYNSPRALALCLTSVAGQSERPDSIAIADDGSGPETAAAIAAFAAAHPQLAIRHVWHEDRGFEKAAILNRAIANSEADFLWFIDGDVLIHPRFLARHREIGRPGRFSTGSLIRLGPDATAAVTPEMVRSGTVFDRDWLRAQGAIDRLGTWLKTMPFPKPVMAALDAATPVQRALCGANASLFRADALRVNGFDEGIKYGGGDKEFGVRLANAGVCGQHLRYTAPLVHLDHARGYRDAEKIRRHKEKIGAVRSGRSVWTDEGIVKGPASCA